MNKRPTVHGLTSFVLTPTTSAGSIDCDRLCGLADEQIAAGVNGVALFGSTGAVGSFAEEERRHAAQALVHHVAGRVPVMIGTGAITTAEAIRLSRHADEIGADAILVVPITYWLLTDDEILAHYRAIAGSVRLPLMLYNNPRLTGVDLTPPIVEKLAGIENITAIKESCPDLMRTAALSRQLGDRIDIFAGRDSAALEALQVGAKHWASGLATIVPHHCVALYRHVQSGDIAAARALWRRMAPFADFVMTKGLVRACHTMLEVMGRPAGQPPAPIQRLSAADAQRMEQLAIELGEPSAPSARVEAAE